MKGTTRPEIPCDACLSRLLDKAPADTPESPDFRIFDLCTHRNVLFCLKRTSFMYQWLTYSPPTIGQLETCVELQRRIDEARGKWNLTNAPEQNLLYTLTDLVV